MKTSNHILYIILGFGILLATISCTPKKVSKDPAASITNVAIKENERGVLVKKDGGSLVTNDIYAPGKHKISNSNQIVKYNIESQSYRDEINILSKEGRIIKVDIEFFFRPIPEELPQLHNMVGQKYKERLVVPEIRSAIRTYFGEISANDISSDREKMFADGILAITRMELGNRLINMERAQVFKIELL